VAAAAATGGLSGSDFAGRLTAGVYSQTLTQTPAAVIAAAVLAETNCIALAATAADICEANFM
jgi:hypothetical protein